MNTMSSTALPLKRHLSSMFASRPLLVGSLRISVARMLEAIGPCLHVSMNTAHVRTLTPQQAMVKISGGTVVLAPKVMKEIHTYVMDVQVLDSFTSLLNVEN